VFANLPTMNDRQREQVERIISHCSASSRAALALSLTGVKSRFSLAGRLGSGAIMTTAVDEIGRAADQLLSELVLKIAPVSRTPEAFEELESAMRRWLRASEAGLPELALQSRSHRLQDGSSAALEAGRAAFGEMRAAIERRLQIEKFDFEQSDQLETSPHATRKERKGGRPPADFWDEMWSAIAVQLYDGTLNPKTQAQVERAMSEWIEGNGFSAAASTVRARARRLWDKLCKLTN
jgi:hypothetical protein